MFDRIGNGWELAKQSYRVLQLDKELLLFPVMSGLACLLVMASFAVPLFATGQFELLMDGQQNGPNPLAYVVAFLFYFANYFVIVFFNTALVACAIVRFNGGDPTVGTGFNAAISRLPQIFGWALLSATVGFILKLIESRSDKVGQILTSLLGMAWGALTYFVVPILVVEKLGPIGAVKRSVSVLRKTWGEALAANFGIGLVVTLVSLLAIIPGAIGVYFGIAFGQTAALIAGVAISVVLLVIISLVSSALNAIVVGALYVYAAEGRVPEYFDESNLSGAFYPK